MRTALLDVHDETLSRRAYEAMMASRTANRPWYEPPSYSELIVDWRHEDKAEPKVLWVAEEHGEVAGVGTLHLPMEDNTSMAWCEVHVRPDLRRRGHGTALMGEILERSKDSGRSQILTEFLVPDEDWSHPYRQFMDRHNFSLSNTEVIRHLDLPMATERFTRLDAETRPRWQGRYRIHTYVNGVPEPLRQSLCDVMNQLVVDAPTGDIEFEPESMTPERYAEYLGVERNQGRVRLTTVALAESGEVVAYTDLMLPAGAPTTVWQWGTYVHREHRGSRLGMAVKLENLRRLQADHPNRKRVTTGNDGTNSWMVSINEELGFRVVELCPAYQRKL
jgi:GNAT superfamily N-acetyltransferase